MAGGYSKRPLWQWIMFCLVIAALLYALVYYFVFTTKGNNYQTGQNQYPTVTKQQAVTTTTPSSPAQQQNTVTLTQNGWSPKILTINAGETVIWINKSGIAATVNSNPHPTHTNYPPLNLGIFQNNESLSLTFTKAGIYGYHNHLNPSEKGIIIVR